MKTMKTVKTAVAIVLLLCAGMAGAAMLDLNGGDRTVTDVADLAGYDGVTNSSGTPSTLTFNLADGLDQAYGGVISGNILLVKQGDKSKLTLTGSNSYTGGTRIDGGVIVAGSATACGDALKTVTISTFYVSSAVTGPWCALQIDVSGFANPISLPAGTTEPGWIGNTYISHSLCVTNNGISIDSPISGGYFSLLATKTFGGNVGAAGMALGANNTGTVTFNGSVTCTGMKVYMYGDVHFCGAVTNSLADISGAGYTALPKYHFYSAANRFNGTRFSVQRGYVYAEADDVFDGLDAISFGKSDGDGRLYLQGHGETVGRTLCISATAAATANNQTVVGGTAAGKHALLSMRGGEDTVSNLRFTGNMTLEWDPTGDYTFTATSNRTSTLTGPVVVKRGTFELDGGHTMLNVTSIVVKAGATLKMASGTPFASSVTIEAESGATLDLAGDMTATTVKVGDRYLSARGFPAGAYHGLTITGAGTLYVTSRPGGEGTYTWIGGGTNDNITTAANWQGGDAPDFEGESPFIVFAGGTAAVLNKDVVASGITFDDVTAFDLSAADGHVLSLGAGGISNAPAASASAVTVSASVMPIVDQIWQMDTNVTFTLSGILRKYGTSTPTIIVRQSSMADPTITFIGAATAEDAGDFAGDVVFEETALEGGKYGTAYVRAIGHEPFGPGGTLKLRSQGRSHNASSRMAMLSLSNAVISKTVQYGEYYSAYYCAEDNTTNVMNGAFTPYNGTSWDGSFPPLFKVGANSVLRLCGDMSFVNRDTATADVVMSSSASAVADKPTGKVVFDGRITTMPHALKLGNSIGLELNAPENVVSNLYLRHGDNATAVVKFGTDYALSNGVAMVTFPTYDSKPVDFDLCGTTQHIQGFAARYQSNRGSTSRILSSDGPGTLRISQASDVEFDAYVATNVTIQMDGSATLTFAHETAFKAGSTLVLSNGTVAVSNATALNEDVALKFLGGKISIPSGQTAQVGEAFYLDEHGQLKQLPRGTYGPGSEKIGEFFAPGSGSVHMRKGRGRMFVIIVK